VPLIVAIHIARKRRSLLPGRSNGDNDDRLVVLPKPASTLSLTSLRLRLTILLEHQLSNRLTSWHLRRAAHSRWGWIRGLTLKLLPNTLENKVCRSCCLMHDRIGAFRVTAPSPRRSNYSYVGRKGWYGFFSTFEPCRSSRPCMAPYEIIFRPRPFASYQNTYLSRSNHSLHPNAKNHHIEEPPQAFRTTKLGIAQDRAIYDTFRSEEQGAPPALSS
jgi:hypothetical protein